RANGNRVIDYYRLLLHYAHAQDGHLRLIDHRSSDHTAEPAEAGDGKCPALDFIRLKLARTGAGGQIDDGALQPEHVLLVRLADDRHDEAVLQRHRDPDIDLVVIDDV